MRSLRARSLGALLVSLAGALASSLVPREARAQAGGLDYNGMARKLVERMALTSGERVLLVGVPGMADAIVAPLRQAVRRAGGEDLGALAVQRDAPPEWSTPFTNGAAGKGEAELTAYLTGVDVAVMLPGATVSDPAYAAMQRVIGAPSAGRARTIHFHWAGAYSLDGRLLPTSAAHAFAYQRALLSADYAALAARQGAFETAARGATIRVTTPAGTDLRFRVGDRPVTKQDGDASAARAAAGRNLIDREIELPAGAIRVAPLEESVEGSIAFPDGEWGGEAVQGLVMRFSRGRLASFTARTGRAGVERELADAGEAGRSFREFALGFNPLLAIPSGGERWIPYYGYGAGVVRLSLGDNTELGGKVTGGYVRWNFFTDATVRVGADRWVQGGAMVR